MQKYKLKMFNLLTNGKIKTIKIVHFYKIDFNLKKNPYNCE